ncbi:MAG: holo-ACP synthase [candidate division WOR-3 bacterium]|jgi:holo-[acyl-carrier protein] synthase
MNVGIDIVEIERIKNLYEKFGERFLKRVFTDNEINYCFSRKNVFHSLAGRFAIKEAVLKALGIGMTSGFSFKDIEVINVNKGKPVVILNGKLKELLNNREIEISISHSEHYAVGICIIWYNLNNKK